MPVFLFFLAAALAASQLWLHAQATLPTPWMLGLPGSGLLLAGLFGYRIARLHAADPARLTVPAHARHRCLRLYAAAALLLAFFLLGLGYGAWRAGLRLVDRLDAALEQQPLEIRGRIVGLPAPQAYGWRFQFVVEEAPVGVPGHILLTDYQRPPSPWRAGQRWRFTVKLKHPHGNYNPGRDDYEGWLLAQGIGASGYVLTERQAPRTLLAALADHPAAWLDHLRERIAERIRGHRQITEATASGSLESFRAGLSPEVPRDPDREILAALAVGDRARFDPAQWTLLRNTGTTHLVAISGLHVGLIATQVGLLIGWAWRRSFRLTSRLPAQYAALLSGGVMAWVYTALAGFQVSALRAAAMLSLAVLLRLSGYSCSALTIWLLALILIVLGDPWAVQSASFWLSFLLVGALLWVFTARPAPDTRLENPHAENPPQAAPPSAISISALASAPASTLAPPTLTLRLAAWGNQIFQRLGFQCLRQAMPRGMRRTFSVLGTALRSQGVVVLASLPLLLFFFRQFPLSSPLANALVIPLFTLFAVPLALLGMLDPSGALWAFACVGIGYARAVLELLAAPFWQWQQSAPPGWALALATVGITLWLVPRGMPGRGAAWLLFVPLLFPPEENHTAAPHEAGAFQAVVWDVGQGLAVAVRTAQHALLFDTGPEASGGSVLPQGFSALGLNRLDTVVVSHRDADHSGGARAVRNSLPVARWMGYAPHLPIGEHWEAVAPCQAGESWEWDGVRFTLLAPEALPDATAPSARHGRKKKRRPHTVRSTASNERACVLRIEGAGGSLLIPSDIGFAEEAALRTRWADALVSTVLIVPHHGSRYSSSEAFLAAVRPQLAIATSGYRNPYHHPHPDTLARYREAGILLWRSDSHGAVLLDFPVDAVWRAQSWRQAHPRYWHRPQQNPADTGQNQTLSQMSPMRAPALSRR